MRWHYDNLDQNWDFEAGWNNEPNTTIRQQITDYIMLQPQYNANNMTPEQVAQRIQGLWESMNAQRREEQRQSSQPLEQREDAVRQRQHRTVLESRRNRVSDGY